MVRNSFILPFITLLTTINRISWIRKKGWYKVIVLIKLKKIILGSCQKKKTELC